MGVTWDVVRRGVVVSHLGEQAAVTVREASNVASEHEVRISDHDRNEVIDQLRAFTGDGRLTLDEFEERVEVVLTARTRSELAPALADLPPVPLSIDQRPPPPAPPASGR